MFELLYTRKCKKRFKTIKAKSSTKFKAYDYSFRFYPFQHNNIYKKIELRGKFHAKKPYLNYFMQENTQHKNV